jgi:ssDNA-binding Zn-finger/Zn-ribbon topoisomerase 1
MYSKADQLKNNKVKVKKVGMFEKKHKIKHKRNATDEDLLYFNWLRSEIRFCIVCGVPCECYHHIKESSMDKKIHSEVIPLCNNHHDRDLKLSAHKNKKEFTKIFPIESQRILASKLYEEFLASSFNNESNELELCFEETM